MTAIIDHGCRVRRGCAADVALIVYDPRPDEIEQMCAIRGWEAYDPELAARWIIGGLTDASWTMVGADGLPFAIGGLDVLRPGVAEVWGIGTMAGWDRYWWQITKQSRRVIDGALARGFHRVETVALASRTAAHEWYRRGLRLREEGLRVGHFANGADGIGFAITRNRT